MCVCVYLRVCVYSIDIKKVILLKIITCINIHIDDFVILLFLFGGVLSSHPGT